MNVLIEVDDIDLKGFVASLFENLGHTIGNENPEILFCDSVEKISKDFRGKVIVLNFAIEPRVQEALCVQITVQNEISQKEFELLFEMAIASEGSKDILIT